MRTAVLVLLLAACGSPAVTPPDQGPADMAEDSDLAGRDLAAYDAGPVDLAGYDLVNTILPGQNGGPCAGTACANGLRCLSDPTDPIPRMCLSPCYGGRSGQPCVDSNCNVGGKRCEAGLTCSAVGTCG